MILEQVGRLQVLIIDRVVLAHQRERRFVVKILPLALHILVRFRQQFHGFAAPVAALLAARHPPLAATQIRLSLPVTARVVEHGAIRQRGERYQAEVDPGPLARWC
jgi:hypothetical protein